VPSVESEEPNGKRQCVSDFEPSQGALLVMKRQLKGLKDEEVVWQDGGASLCVSQLRCLWLTGSEGYFNDEVIVQYARIAQRKQRSVEGSPVYVVDSIPLSSFAEGDAVKRERVAVKLKKRLGFAATCSWLS